MVAFVLSLLWRHIASVAKGYAFSMKKIAVDGADARLSPSRPPKAT